MSGVSGLARGLAVTLRTLSKRTVTAEYPDVAPSLPPRSRGVIALLEENCTVCMLCARECPDWCIYIDSHKESVEVEGAARPRQRNVLDRFAIDYGLCMYCGICVEVCPFDALFWSPQFEYSTFDVSELTHEKERLREWMWTVPPAPVLDSAAPEPKELAAPTRPARAAGERPARAAGERPARAAGAGRARAGERPVRRTGEPAGAPETPPAAPSEGSESAAGEQTGTSSVEPAPTGPPSGAGGAARATHVPEDTDPVELEPGPTPGDAPNPGDARGAGAEPPAGEPRP